MSISLTNTGVTFPDSTAQTTAGVTSMAATGYVKTPKGFYIQWSNNSTTPGSPSTISYPTAFPNTCLGIYINYTNNTGDQMYAAAVTSRNTSNFTIAVNLGKSQTCNYCWIAIGY